MLDFNSLLSLGVLLWLLSKQRLQLWQFILERSSYDFIPWYLLGDTSLIDSYFVYDLLVSEVISFKCFYLLVLLGQGLLLDRSSLMHLFNVCFSLEQLFLVEPFSILLILTGRDLLVVLWNHDIFDFSIFFQDDLLFFFDYSLSHNNFLFKNMDSMSVFIEFSHKESILFLIFSHLDVKFSNEALQPPSLCFWRSQSLLNIVNARLAVVQLCLQSIDVLL